MSPEAEWSRQHDARLLKEMVFLFQSIYFYLEHLDTRLHVWASELRPLLVLFPEQRERLLVLEQELESSTSLLEELHRPEMSFPAELQSQMQALQLYYADLDALEQRLMGYLQQLEGLEQEYLDLAETHRQTLDEVLVLNQAVLAGEQEIASLSLRNESLEQDLAEQARQNDEQIENLNEIIEKTARETWALQKNHQEAGVSLVRIAQVKNEAESQIQILQRRLLALENENAELLKGIAEQMVSPLPVPHPVQEKEKRNQIRYQTCLELFSLLPLSASLEQEKLIRTLKTGLHISDAQAESLQTLVDAGLGHVNHVLQPHLQALQPMLPMGSLHPLSVGMVWVPEGIYPIGDDLHTAERPAHSLKNEGFLIGVFPVTNAEFAQFMAEGGYQQEIYWLPEGWRLIQAKSINAPAFWNTPGHSSGEDYPDYPVVGISWYEANAFATWAGKRLPTETEWEMACRGVEGLIWPWGNDWEAGWANTAEAGILNLAPVGWHPKSKSIHGCHDLIGQCYEWTSSLYLPYPYHREQAEDRFRTEPRSLRGCAWSARGPYFTRASYRFFQPPEHRHSDIGFRIVQNGGNNLTEGGVI